jgi:two-component system phosphate regulon response regulator OmpR
VLVVDDDPRLAELLRKYLSDNGYRVTTAGNADETRTQLKGLTFDLIVLDVMMPGEDGIALTADLRRTSEIPVLLLTARTEAEDRIAGLEAGADDYLAKPFEPRELLLRIEAILRRTTPPPVSPTLTLGALEFDLERGTLTQDGAPVRLTSAEADLLRVFARHPRTVLSRADIVSLGVNPGEDVGDRAIDVQIARLRRKIEVDPKNPRTLQTVWGEGYVLWPD